MGQEFDISVSRNLSINAILSATGGSVSLYMPPLLFAGVLSLVPMDISVFPSPFHLCVCFVLFFIFSFKRGISEHTYGFFGM